MSETLVTVPACILEVSAASGVPVCDLTTIAMLYGLQGEPHDTMVILAPHVDQRSTSGRAWSDYTWSGYMKGRREERSRSRTNPWPVRSVAR